MYAQQSQFEIVEHTFEKKNIEEYIQLDIDANKNTELSTLYTDISPVNTTDSLVR
jgi:hypothetical protein